MSDPGIFHTGWNEASTVLFFSGSNLRFVGTTQVDSSCQSEKWVGEHVGMDAGLEHSMEATRKGVTDASGTTLVVGTPSTHYWTLSGNPQKGTSQWVSDAMKKGGRYLRRVVSTLDVVSIVM